MRVNNISKILLEWKNVHVKQNSTWVLVIFAILLLEKMSLAQEQLWVDPRLTELELPLGMTGPFIKLSDGSVMVLQENATAISKDNGHTWSEPHPIYTGSKPGIPSIGVFLQTWDGVIVLVYLDLSTYEWGWNHETAEATDNVQLDGWGKSWSKPVVIARLGTDGEPLSLKDGRTILRDGLSYPAIF